MREAPYIEAARAYGAGGRRIVLRYMIPRIMALLIPRIIILVPGYVFLEATLAFLGVSDPLLPTWSKLIVAALSFGVHTGATHLVLLPLGVLFLTGFARDVLDLRAPCLIVHGAGEAAERALEAQGRIPEYEGGVIAVETDADRALVVRAAGDLNRRIAHTLNDAGVAAVRLEASGRGLIRPTDDGIEAGKVGWLRKIVAQGAVPVVAALVGGSAGEAREANGGAVAGVLARALSDAGEVARVIFLTRNGQNGLVEGDSVRADVGLEMVSERVMEEPEAVRAALAAGADALVTGRSGLRQTPILGTRIRLLSPK